MHSMGDPAPQVSDPVGLVWGLGMCISNKCSDDADTVRTTDSAPYMPFEGELSDFSKCSALGCLMGADRPHALRPEAAAAGLACGPWEHRWAH